MKHNAGCTEIEVAENGVNIPDNNGTVAFDTTTVGNPIIKTFTISNTDQTDLILTPPITVPTGFSVTSSFGKTILATGEQTTFTVQLDALNVGSYSGELIFANNDVDENPFNFTIRGVVESSITPAPTPTPVGNCCCVVIALGGTCEGARTRLIFQRADLIYTYIRFRDERLQTTVTGQRYIRLYNENTHELAGILLTDSDLRSRTSQFLNNASDEFGSLLLNATSTVTLSQALYDEANVLVEDLAAKGSAEFSATMMLTWDNLGLEQHIGEETTEIWEQVQHSYIYLPITLK